jgi:hypothetical protein
MIFTSFLACTPQPPVSNFYLSLENNVVLQLEISSLDIRPEGTSFYEPWVEIELEREGAVTLDSLALTKIGSKELTHRSSYIQSFPDVENIFLDLDPIQDIVEPIATPFKAKNNYIYDVVINLAIIEEQLFAVDASVREYHIDENHYLED